MKTIEQLSQAQKRVVFLLKSDKDSYCTKGMYYNFQHIILPNKKDSDTWCCRPTLLSLIRYNVIVLSEIKERYVLNPNFEINEINRTVL